MSPSQPNPSNENLTIAPFFETLEPRLLLSGVQGAEHARLLFDDTQLADIRANLTQEPYASMVARLIETAESGDPGDEPSMNDSANLQRTSFLYALTGDDIWAQKARTYAENRIFDTGVEAWADPSVKGLRLYMHGKAVALAYDFAFDAPSWNTDDFKEIVSQKLLEQADVVFESGGTEQNKDPASNWQGNRWSSAAIMYMATDEAFPEGRLDVAFDHVVEYLDANVGSDPRAAGWNIEGVGYLGYPFGSFVGPYGIMAERYDPYDMNLKEVSPASQSTAWTQYAATVPFHGSLIRPDFGDDHASALAAEGVYGLALGYAPAELQPGLHYWYDRTVGTEGEGTGDFDVRRAGTIYGLMYYDDDIVQQDPMTMPEWRKRFLDSYGNGFFTFRNQYLDSTDLVSQFYAKLRGETGHSGPDALSFRILGLDTAWAVGGGRGGLNLNGTEAYYRSQNTLYKNDPQTGTISVNGNSGSVVGNPLIQEDGSGHVVTQISKNNLGVNNQKRWYLSDFSKDAGVDGVFVVGDTSDDGYFWNFNTLEENAVSTNGNTFLIQGQDGATLKGTVLYAPGGVTWSTGTRIRGTEFSQQIENFDDDENNYVSYQSTSGDHLVVMTIARAGQTHPTVSMSGSSVEGAVVTVGSKTYTLTSDDVLYDGQVAQRSPIASYSATPDRGMYPLTVTFDAGDSFDPDGDSLTYFWEFGDGSTATGEVVQHTYTTEGLFNARLTIDDGFGNIDRVTKSISARNQPPTARFTMDTNYGAAPLVVNFDGSTSTDPENDTLTYTWDFGDGSTGTGVTPSHTYDIPGNYTVVLTVDDGNGNQHTSDQTLLASRPMDGGGRANTIVDWSGDKIGVDKITLDQDEYRVTLDIDNDGQADDTWARIDLDLGLPLSPDNNYFAQPFYGGASSREIDGTSAQLADFQLGDNVEGDSFYFRTGGNKRDLDLLIYFDKQDFFHGGSNYAVSFNTDSSISMGGVLNSSNIESYRWVVREGTTFYVSEKVATPSTGYTLTFEADNDDGRWAVYDPTSGIDFDQDAATFTSQNFSNVTAVGLVVDSDLVNSTEKRFAFDEFKVVADVDSPPATPQRPTVFNTAFEIVEQMPNGTILGSVQAADPNPSDTLTWSILQGNEDGVWTINSSTGEISVADNTNLRYYRNADFKLTVQATDNTGRTGIGFVDVTTIQILPYNAEPSLSDGLMKVLDNAPNGQLVGQMLLDDANVDQYHDFKITSGNAAGIFAIDPQTGAITVVNNSSLNASAQSRYNLNIRAQDPFGIVTTAVAMVDVLPAPATSQTAIIEFGGDVLDGSQILGREFTYGADLDGNGGDSVELVPFTATPLINETVGYRGPKFYGGFLAQTLNGSTSVNPTVGGSGGDDTLNIEYNPGGLGTMNGFIFVDKADFVHGGDSATVTFDSSSSLRLREVARFQGFDDVRWLVRDGSNFYVSEQKPNASNGYTLTFASDTNDGNWASFDPYASYDFDEATTFQSRNFTNITAVGLYLGRDIPDGDRQWLTIGGLDVYAKTAGANVPPIAVTDTATTAEDTATNINVTANDIDPTSGETLTVVSVSQPDFGTAAINGSQVTYTPDTGYRGVDSFIYTVVDSAGNESHGLVNVSVGTGNLPPSAWAKLASVEENQSVVVDVLSNDSDPENDSLSVQSVTQGAHGTVINNGSSVTYTPDSEYFGTDSFTYTVTDGNGNSDTATIYMTITEVPPQSPFGNGGQPWPVADGLRIEAENFDAGVNGDAYFDTGAGNNGGRYRTDVDVDIQDASDSSGIYNLAWNADGEWLEYSVDVTGGTYDIVLRVASGLTNPGSIRLLLDGQELGVVKVPATGSMQSWTDATLSDVSLTGGPGILRMEIIDGGFNINYMEFNQTGGPTNQAPTATNDTAVTNEDTAVVVDVLANDSDPDTGDTLGVQSVTQGSNGSVTNNGSNVTYTPNAGFTGSDSFTYTVSDGNGGSDTATVNVTVNATGSSVGDFDIAEDIGAVAASGSASYSSGTYTVTASGADVWNDADEFHYVHEALTGDGQITARVVSQDNTHAWAKAGVMIRDGVGAGAKNVFVGVTPGNGAAMFYRDTTDGISDRTNNPAASTPLWVRLTRTGNSFLGEISSDGQSWTPLGTINISMPSTVRIGLAQTSHNDGVIGSASYDNVSVSGSSANQDPTASNDSASTNQDTAVVVDVLNNDSDPDAGDTLSVQSVTQGSNGSVTNNGSNVTYTPNAGFTGSDSFTYTVSDGNGGSDTATVNVTVNAVNQDPTATNDTAVTSEDTAVVVDVLNNDSDPDAGDTLSVQSVTQGSNGSVTNNGSNVTYTPNTGFTGSDSFTYTVSDGNGGSDTATVNVTVNASGGTTLSDDFNDNEGTNYSGWTEVPDTDRYIETGGRLDWNAGSDESEHLTLFNTPISSNDFTIDVKVTADDNVGTFFIYFAYQDSNNWYRLAVDDGASSQFEKSVGGTVTEVGLAGPGVNIAKNGALTSWQLVSDATAGTLAFNSGGANVLTISESLAFTGGQIGLGGIDRRPIWDDFVVTTNGGVVNQDPTAVNDSATTNEDTPTVIDVLANDSDPDTGDTLSVFDIVQPTHGTVVNNGSDVTYTPDSGYFGSDSFSYTVSDGNGGSDTATVNVTVNEVNQDPIAVNDSASTNEDTPTVIDVLANDSDPDTGDTLSVFDIVQPTHGTVVNNGSDVTYTPDSGYFGSDSFSYTVSDGNGGSDTATVNVTVNEITSGIGDFTANADIGAVTVTGSASYSGGVYTVSGGGEDIWLTADEFHFVHQSMTGDGEIIARIVSQDNSHPWAKTGVMIRDGLNADAANAMMGLTPGNGAGLFYRTSTGVTSQRTNTTSASTPIWVKLTRSGNTLTGYTSSNGQDWNWVGNITISMSSTVDVGLAVSSHVDGVLATASFDNVSVGDIFINQDPQASDDSASTNQNVPTVIDVLANDTDPNVGTVLTVDSVTQGANGTVTNNGSNVTYTPNAGFTGPDSFTYVVADGDGGTDTATVTVTVTGLSVGDFDEHRDIGATVLTGSASESSGTYTLTASGADIWNRADEFHFAYKPMVGDGEIVIRLTAMDNTHPWAKAGVMIRESLDPVSTFALMAQTPGNGASFAYRTETAQDAARDPLLGPGSASWLKLVRDGNTFQGYYSTDGLSWTPNGDPVEIIMDGTAYVGLAYTSHDNAVVGTASFDNLTIIETTGNHAPLAVDDQVRVAMNTPTTVAVLANDYDPDASDSLAVSAVTQPTHGTVVNNGSDVTYTPNTDYLGNDSFDYTVSDGNGGTRTATVTIDVADMGQYNVTSTSYLGGSGSIDAVRGAAILSDGTLVYAAEISDATPGGLTPVLLNGATTSSGGAVVRMSADGKTVLSVTRVADRIIDMATDDNDNIYLATFDDGFLKLNADADQLIWAKTFTGQNVWRVDAGPSGYSAVHLHGDTLGDVDRSDPGPGEIRVFNPSGTELGSYAGHNNTLDVAIDEASQTVITIGWRQASAFEGTATLPVQISYFRGHAYDGTLKYTGYDWSSNQSDPGFLNRPENNMADTRGMRATIGDDGKLYLAFEAAGGNHIFRYQPTLDTNDNFVSASSLIVGGDAYHQFFASASEHKTFVGRYEPGTGEFLLGQQFTARSTVDGDANGLRIKEGDIRADAEGRIYLGLHSASGVGNDLKDQGLPYSYSPDALEDGYGGGATLIVMSSDFTQRLFVGRVTNSGYVRALAVDTQGGDMVVAAGGDMEVVDPLVTIDPVQAAAGGGTQDGMVFTLRADLPPTGQSSFVENNGMVSVEAENYTNSTTGTGVASGIDWTTTTGTTGYSGTSAVTTSSNTGVSAGDSTVGPRLDYDINFNTTGTYYVWVRMLGNGGSNDSLHIGLDGSPASFGHLGVTHNSSNWHWEQNVGGSRLTLNVTSAGIHTLNMWMREDGVLVDKIVLTTDSQYTPSGFGPGETV